MKLLDTEWIKRWPDFQPSEVLSMVGMYMFDRGTLLIQTHALDLLQKFRTYLNIPFRINHNGLHARGYRSCGENNMAKGEQCSFHIQGLAFDITPVDMPVETFADIAAGFGWHGIGLYPKHNFVHLDLRPQLKPGIVRWTISR